MADLYASTSLLRSRAEVSFVKTGGLGGARVAEVASEWEELEDEEEDDVDMMGVILGFVGQQRLFSHRDGLPVMLEPGLHLTGPVWPWHFGNTVRAGARPRGEEKRERALARKPNAFL